MVLDHNCQKILKKSGVGNFCNLLNLNTFWTLTPISQRVALILYRYIYMSFLIKLSTRNSNLMWKPQREVVLAAILTKNRKNGQKWDCDPYISKIRPHTLSICISFLTKSRRENQIWRETGNGSSFVRHFDENPQKRLKISGNRSVFRKF